MLTHKWECRHGVAGADGTLVAGLLQAPRVASLCQLSEPVRAIHLQRQTTRVRRTKAYHPGGDHFSWQRRCQRELLATRMEAGIVNGGADGLLTSNVREYGTCRSWNM